MSHCEMCDGTNADCTPCQGCGHEAEIEAMAQDFASKLLDANTMIVDKRCEIAKLRAVAMAAKDYSEYDPTLFLTTNTVEEGEWFERDMCKSHRRLLAALSALKEGTGWAPQT